MSTIYSLRKHALIPLSLFVLFLLAFLCTGCGQTGTGGQNAAGANAPATSTTGPTSVKGSGGTNGCPGNMAVSTAPTKANVILELSNANTTSTAHNGDVIEIRLPFGYKWGNPVGSHDILQIQSPAGYAWKTNNVCIWHFTAQGTGTAQLNFSGRPVCKRGQMCPMFIIAVPFKIIVK